MLSDHRVGDIITGDVLARRGGDDAMDRAVARGFVTEIFYETPDDDDTPDEPVGLTRDDSLEDWQEYAAANGVDVDGLDVDDIADLFLTDDE
jgi:hypothetical protein